MLTALPTPETFVDGDRAARAVTVADRLLVQLPLPSIVSEGEETPDLGEFSAPDAACLSSGPTHRQRLRVVADRILTTVTALKTPDSFAEGERAGRFAASARRMVIQLYAAPKPRAIPDIEADVHDEAVTPEHREDDLIERLYQRTRALAVQAGFWPDGSRYDPANPDSEEIRNALWTFDVPVVQPIWEQSLTVKIAHVVTARANAMTRAQAADRGRWPGGEPYKEADPDYWGISVQFTEVVGEDAAARMPEGYYEEPGPGVFGWLIRPRFPVSPVPVSPDSS